MQTNDRPPSATALRSGAPFTQSVTLQEGTRELGVKMPLLGLGVFRAGSGQETIQAVRYAIEQGYRHIDTARIYNNEREVGEGVRAAGVPRDQLFITTKLWNADHGFESTLNACEKSLKLLGMDYLDLYLIHWPVAGLRQETWRAMEYLLREGRTRAIGVSNYTVRHLDELLAGCNVPPAVNQVEFSPFLSQRKLLGFCRARGIQLEAPSPLTKGQRLAHPVVTAIAARCDRTPAQVLIRWCLEQEVVVIPKSVRPERIVENCGVFDFDLSPDDLQALDGLNEELHTAWDPTNAA